MTSHKLNLFIIKLRTWYIICTGFLFLFSSCSKTPTDTFELTGNAKGLDGNKAVLIVSTLPGKADTLGQFEVKDGHFQLTGKIHSPVMATLLFSAPKYYASFWLEPGSIDVSLDTAKAENGMQNSLEPIVKGSKEQDLYESFAQNYKVVYKNLDAAYDSLKKAKDPTLKEKLEDRVDKLRDDAQEVMRKKILDFARKNNSSVVAAYLMRGQIEDYDNSVDTLDAILSGFTDNVKKSVYFSGLEKDLSVLKRVQPGKEAPDFTLLDPKDKEISLSSLKGKVVLIDFWASWCKPCIASMPDLKKVYSTYKNKGFEILGVSDDSKKDAWIKSMKENELPWLNVVDEFPKPPEPFGPARVGVLYGIHYIPATVLINREGIIAAKNLHGKELREKLNEIL
jgi:peroxiredoxin